MLIINKLRKIYTLKIVKIGVFCVGFRCGGCTHARRKFAPCVGLDVAAPPAKVRKQAANNGKKRARPPAAVGVFVYI